MRGFAIAMFAGLLAMTLPATALYAPGDDFRPDNHDVILDLTDQDCADGAVLCIIDIDETYKWTPNGATVNFTLRNRAAVNLQVEIRTIPDPSADDASRHSSNLLAGIEVPAGEEIRVDGIVISDQETDLRVQMTDGTNHAELDTELLNVQIMAFKPGEEDPAASGPSDDQSDVKKESPFTPALWIVAALGVAALLVGFGRRE